MSKLTRLIVFLAVAVTIALVAVVLYAFAQSSPRSVPVFLLLMAVPLGAIGWMLWGMRRSRMAASPANATACENESIATHAQD